MGYYEWFRSDADGQWYFVLKAANHEVIATSEGYTTKAAMLNGIASVQANGPTTEVKERKA